MKALWDAGLRVPEDVAIVGAGEIALGDLVRVPLTTVSWSRDQQGKEAARLLLDRIGPEPSAGKFQSVVIPPQLIVRRSSGGPV
jgi:LacI family transcriptional regulator